MSKLRVRPGNAVAPDTFAGRLRELRESKKLAQRELAETVGVSHIQYGRYERGLSLPNAESLQRLAESLEVSGDYLLNGATESAAKGNFEDLELLRMFQEAQALSLPDKEMVKGFLDAFLFKRKVQAMSR
jgi:transcriptional regulator with XRE-family HTH domain